MPYNRLPISDGELIAQYAAGSTAAELGERFGYSAAGIRSRLRNAGAVMRSAAEVRRQRTREGVSPDEIVRLYDEGNGIEKVAAAIGRSATLVQTVLEEQGCPLRPRSAYGRPGQKGFLHSEETKRQRALTKERNGYTTSAFEPEFAAILDAYGIHYVAQKAVGKYSVDFALPALHLAVEVKGPSYTPRKLRRDLASERTAFIESEGWRVVIVRPPFSLDQLTNEGIPCP